MAVYTLEKLNSLVDEALDSLKKDRDREVLRRRGGINTASQTLEQIGQDLSITRERVRQIEKAALTKLRGNANHDHELSRSVKVMLNKRGGLISLESLLEELGIAMQNEPHATFLIRINPEFIYVEKNDNHDRIVAFSEIYDEASLTKLHKQIVETIRDGGKPAKFVQIHGLIDGPHKAEGLMELSKASNQIAELDGMWGLSSWPEVNPRSIRDKIYLILKKTGRPMHFTDISDKISSLAANPKRVTTQAVHNELIKDKRFVLIGRGIYALAEWGYRSGTVADIIEEILKEEKAPLSKDEIVKRVLARRQVKTTTIVLNLQEKPQFKRTGKGIYTLANG